MSPLNSVFFINATIVKPDVFFLTGFTGIPHTEYYYVFLSFIYVVTVLGNAFVMFMIYIDHCLHTPKYIIVFNLAVSDLCGSSTVIIHLIDTFLLKSHVISFAACLAHMFLAFWFVTMESLTLTLLSYDRCIAIFFPLRYNEIVTSTSMLITTAALWIFAAVIMLVAMVYISRLSYCKTNVIHSYFCDHGPMHILACNDNTPSTLMNWTHPMLTVWVPALLIVITYICIARALLKIAAASERLKAMKTCTSHLMLVGVFFFPLGFALVLGSSIHQNARILNMSLATVLPPMLNPIIYSLKTEEFTESIKKFYRRKKQQINVINQ